MKVNSRWGLKGLMLVSACLSGGVLAAPKSAKKDASAAAGAETRPAGDVNWEKQLVRATGAGAPDMRATNPAQARLGAEQAAKLDALRNLLAQVKGIHVSADKTVGDAMAVDEVRAKVEGVVRGYKVVDKRYFSDGGVEIDVEVPLAMVASLVEAAASTATAAETSEPAAKKSTGVLVDARGLKVTPALGLRLVDAQGSAVYAAEMLTAEARQTTVVASFFRGLDDAKKSGKVGDHPLVVKVARVDGTDLFLSADDAKKVSEGTKAALREGHVAVVSN